MTTQLVPGPIKSGRPRSTNTDARKFYDGKLYALLLKAMPQHVEGGRLSPKKVADAIGVHKFTVYKWLTRDFLSQKGANLLIEKSDGELTAKDLISFVLS